MTTTEDPETPNKSPLAVARGRMGGLTKSSRYPPQELTAPALAGFLHQFLDEVDERSPGLPEEERQRRARALLKAHMTRLAWKSAEVRREKSRRRNASGGAA